MTGIKIAADMYRDYGQWHLHICAPEWIIKEWANEIHAGGKIGLAGYGGPYTGDMLDMTIVLLPAQQEAKSDVR